MYVRIFQKLVLTRITPSHSTKWMAGEATDLRWGHPLWAMGSSMDPRSWPTKVGKCFLSISGDFHWRTKIVPKAANCRFVVLINLTCVNHMPKCVTGHHLLVR